VAARKRSTAHTAALPATAAPALARVVPSPRSLAVGVALFVLAAAAYGVARETSLFAVRILDVRGGTPLIRAQVRRALASEEGVSLLRVDGRSLGALLAPLPTVRSFTYDRAFPNTLRVVVRREQAVAVLRRGARAYLVSSTARVIKPLAHARRSHLPRLWVTRDVRVHTGSSLPRRVATAATTLGSLRGAPFPGGIRSVRAGRELTLVLGTGLELRLGDPGDLRLKLTIARKILRSTGLESGSGYLDVSVPERPVLSLKPRVEG
jgi:POTRA domain, FtsQ-type